MLLYLVGFLVLYLNCFNILIGFVLVIIFGVVEVIVEVVCILLYLVGFFVLYLNCFKILIGFGFVIIFGVVEVIVDVCVVLIDGMVVFDVDFVVDFVNWLVF